MSALGWMMPDPNADYLEGLKLGTVKRWCPSCQGYTTWNRDEDRRWSCENYPHEPSAVIPDTNEPCMCGARWVGSHNNSIYVMRHNDNGACVYILSIKKGNIT